MNPSSPHPMACCILTGGAAVVIGTAAVLGASGMLAWELAAPVRSLLYAATNILIVCSVLSYQRHRAQHRNTDEHAVVLSRLDSIERRLDGLPDGIRRYGVAMYERGYDDRDQDEPAPLDIPRPRMRNLN